MPVSRRGVMGIVSAGFNVKTYGEEFVQKAGNSANYLLPGFFTECAAERDPSRYPVDAGCRFAKN